MPTSLPRLLLALLVLALLARAGRVAWDRRDLALAVWRAIRPRHVAGSLGLLVAVVTTSVLVGWVAPVTLRGLGDLFATQGNVVFAPVDVAAEASGAVATAGPNALYLAGLTVFLGLLAALLPWFAFVEEEVFRAGAETWSIPVRVVAALVFGAAHLVMLVPVAATIGIAVAGFAYGELYRRGVRAGRRAPTALRSAFRPTRRSARAVARATDGSPEEVGRHVAAQVDGVFTSTVWHTTFNTTVVVLVWATLVLDEVLG